VDDRRLGIAVRARRHRRGWRLVDMAAVAGVGPGVCGLLERGHADRLTVRTARAIAGAVGLPLAWDLGWQRVEVDRLLDSDHAALCADIAGELTALSWEVRTEVSFNHYGERGRIDLLAWHPTERTLLVIEVKTTLVDAQQTIGSLDIKARLASILVAKLGWRQPARVVPALFIAEGRTARRHLQRLAALFKQYNCQGVSARGWLRSPSADVGGLLRFVPLPSSNGSDRRRAGRRRVRRSRATPRSAELARAADPRKLPA
jgi:transcriptional regulator with XRE-family HTH domain